MAKKGNEDFKNSTKCWICDGDYFDDVKVRDYCHVFGKYRGSAHKPCNIKVTLDHKIPVIFSQPKKLSFLS